jgi:polysaccharide pyruvyl transferase WcaK-like protein
MRIALVGWYGHENAGDDRMEHALRSLFREHFVTAFDFDQWKWLPPVLERYDYVIFGGGTLFTNGNNGVRRSRIMLQRSHRPFAVMGVGIDRVPQEYRHHLEWTIANARLFMVRDNQSRERCEWTDEVRVAPDLTWLAPFPVHRRDTTSRVVAVNLAHYGEGEPEVAQAFTCAARRLLPTADLVAWPLSRDVETDDTVVLNQWFRGAEETNPAGLVSGARIGVAHRFHAMIYATQMGLPFIPVVSQKKAAAYLEEMDYPVPPIRSGTEAECEAALRYVLTHEEELAEFLLAARQRYIAAAEEIRVHVTRAVAEPWRPVRALRRGVRSLARQVFPTMKCYNAPAHTRHSSITRSNP